MEGGEKVASTSGGGAPASSRWNPTKEQISMLENLYRQGIRTPSAEQIQHITSRLKAYGHIEGKNVFYWFQNHKARQRQKLKQQDNNPYFTRFLHKTSPLFPPTSSNVVCSPYCLQQGDLGYYPQYHPKLLLPCGIKKRAAKADKMDKLAKAYGGLGNCEQHNSTTIMIQTSHDIDEEAILTSNNIYTTNSNVNDRQTLDLFPLQPGGSPQVTTTPTTSLGTPSASPQYTRDHTSAIEEASRDQPFFDFFPANGPSMSE